MSAEHGILNIFVPINTEIYLEIIFQLTHFMIGSHGQLILIPQPVLSLCFGGASKCHWCTVAGYT